MLNINTEVFHTQKVFRTILDCMARPGKIGRIEKASLTDSSSINNYLSSIAVTLLDREVSFHIYSAGSDENSSMELFTMARHEPLETCDYFFMQGNDAVDFTRLKKGTLSLPDESATVICEVDRIAPDMEQENSQDEKGLLIKVSGPGVKDENRFFVNGIPVDTLSRWKECNSEFPLGVDMILVDGRGNLCCLPRAVKLLWEEF